MRKGFVALLLCLAASWAYGADQTIGVFVALADNEHQGIVRVPASIGNGTDPERNLYWGTAEGLKGVFDKSKEWTLTDKVDQPKAPGVLRTRTYHHNGSGTTLYARAYRGADIKRCIKDFEAAIQAGSHDLLVFIGHNGLMDFTLPAPGKKADQKRRPDCAVLCCKSEKYFRARIESAGGRPVLLTTQFMYPGSFILHAIVGPWLEGGDLDRIRESAGAAYARNQKLSKRAGTGVFADLKKKGPAATR